MKAIVCLPDTESRWSVQTGEGAYLSTFGVIGDELRVGDLYLTVLSGCYYSNLGGNAEVFSSHE